MLKIILKTNKTDALEYMPESVYEYISNEECGYFESHAGYVIITFDLYEPRKNTPEEKITVYHSKNATVFMCDTNEGLKLITSLANGKNPSLCTVFSGLIRSEPHRLQALECKINAIEERLIKYSDSECMQEILDLKYELFDLKSYYSQLVTIFEDCAENEDGALDTECAKSLANLQSRGEKLLDFTLELRDYLSQARDACQSQIEIEQNKLMRIFTAITAVFLPLNLLVGWYGMNFKFMSELSHPSGYKAFTIICIIIAMSLVVFFKKRKWF